MTSIILGKIRDELERVAKFTRRRSGQNGYVAFTTADVSSSGGTITLQIANPTDDTSIDVERFIIASQFRGEFAIYDSFSSGPTGGTTESVDNLLMEKGGGNGASPDSGAMDVTSGVTFTEDGTHYAGVVPSGGTEGGAMGGAARGTEPIIEPGREIVVELTNNSANTRPGSIGIVYTEVDSDLA